MPKDPEYPIEWTKKLEDYEDLQQAHKNYYLKQAKLQKQQEQQELKKKIFEYGNGQPIIIDVPSYLTPLHQWPKDPVTSNPKKIKHYTGKIDNYTCLACGIYRDSKSQDIWTVMKRTWLEEDPIFTKCIVRSWNPTTGKIHFIDSPTVSPYIRPQEIREQLIMILSDSSYGSPDSMNASSLLVVLESNSLESVYKEFKQRIKITEAYSVTTKQRLLTILKAVYLNF